VSENGSCLRPRGHCDRQWLGILKVIEKYNLNDIIMWITAEKYTPSIMGTRLRHLSIGDVGRCVIIRKLLDFTVDMLPVFIRRLKIQKCLHGNLVP
jgi:hypothetical protein